MDILVDRMATAVNNYTVLATVLLEDIVELYDNERDSPRRRRTFIRSALALLEGSCHCFLEICVVASECPGVALSSREKALIHDRTPMPSDERIKLAIRLMHRLFEMGQTDFGGEKWTFAMEAIAKRHKLMHPKTPDDLLITDSEWQRMSEGISWLQEQQFSFVRLLHKKYVERSG